MEEDQLVIEDVNWEELESKIQKHLFEGFHEIEGVILEGIDDEMSKVSIAFQVYSRVGATYIRQWLKIASEDNERPPMTKTEFNTIAFSMEWAFTQGLRCLFMEVGIVESPFD